MIINSYEFNYINFYLERYKLSNKLHPVSKVNIIYIWKNLYTFIHPYFSLAYTLNKHLLGRFWNKEKVNKKCFENFLKQNETKVKATCAQKIRTIFTLTKDMFTAHW